MTDLDKFNIFAGTCSIVALGLTVLQQRRINSSINIVNETQKRTQLVAFLSHVREIAKDLCSISNSVSRGKYRGGYGNELKNRIAILIGDLKENRSLLNFTQNELINSISKKIATIDFSKIESNVTEAKYLQEKFEELRVEISEYLVDGSV